jgi:hypothetical protein
MLNVSKEFTLRIFIHDIVAKKKVEKPTMKKLVVGADVVVALSKFRHTRFACLCFIVDEIIHQQRVTIALFSLYQKQQI